tara:strand:+ start:43742 stop:44014 length:273 start_codon:yes stop_codon:yes gene_type:complete
MDIGGNMPLLWSSNKEVIQVLADRGEKMKKEWGKVKPQTQCTDEATFSGDTLFNEWVHRKRIGLLWELRRKKQKRGRLQKSSTITQMKMG